MDSHTPMIGSLGIVGWGVGGFEGGTATLGEPVAMLIPEVIGCRLTRHAAGRRHHDRHRAHDHANAAQAQADRRLRRVLRSPASMRWRFPTASTISNMTPEFGATMGFFPIDAETLRSGRPETNILHIWSVTVGSLTTRSAGGWEGNPLDHKGIWILIEQLLRHPGRVLTRDVLLNAVWGYDYYGTTRTVNVHIRRLKLKIRYSTMPSSRSNPSDTSYLIKSLRGSFYRRSVYITTAWNWCLLVPSCLATLLRNKQQRARSRATKQF